MLVAIDGQLAGMIAVADTIKETSKQAIATLKQMGIDVYMVTGDNKRTAEAIAKQVGIEHVYSEVLPEDKANIVEDLQNKENESRWSATALTTLQLWRKRILEWRLAQAQMSRSRRRM